MKTLRIEDLDAAQALDRLVMSGVRGGATGFYLPLPYYYLPVPVANSTNFSAQQVVGQSSVVNSNGFAAVIPSQHATNTINFFGLPSSVAP